MTYTVARAGTTLGSFTQQQVAAGLATGQFTPDDLAWCEGMADWQRIATLPAFSSGPTPPPLPPGGGLRPPAKHLGDDPAMRLIMPVGISGWAIAAGYMGLFGLVIFPAPIALILSIIAIRDIKKSKNNPHPKHGMGRAVFGLIVGVLGTIVLAAGLFASLTSHH